MKNTKKSYTGTVCGMILNPRLGPMAGNVVQYKTIGVPAFQIVFMNTWTVANPTRTCAEHFTSILANKKLVWIQYPEDSYYFVKALSSLF